MKKANVKGYCSNMQFDGWDMALFERITRFNDVVSLTLVYEDESKLELYVHWKGDSDYSNPSQSSVIDQNSGDIYISFDEDRKAADIFEWKIKQNEIFVSKGIRS